MTKVPFFFVFLCNLFVLCSSVCAEGFDWEQEVHWDWSTLNFAWHDLTSLKSLKTGIAISEFQTCGTATDDGSLIKNNFTQSSQLKIPKNFAACNHWLQWKEDIQLIKSLGITDFRFSIGWDRIEPQKGIFDQAAINHYKEYIKELKAHGIEPWICLFHFTLPTWVENSGGFLNPKNVTYFIRFCEKIFIELHHDVKYWVTFNEIIAYAVEGYMTGKFPPHYAYNTLSSAVGFIQAGRCVKNMLDAHIRIYELYKQIDPSAQIGIIQMFHLIDASTDKILEKFVASQSNSLVNDTILNFFKKGKFSWKGIIRYKNKKAKKVLDFIGVNYYRHQIVEFSVLGKNGIFDARSDEQTAADTDWAIYAEGLYRSILKATELNIPIYVTEFGIADKTNSQRDLFIRKHLYAIKKAIEKGANVRGYFIWSLMDNYEWGCDPFKGPRFGLYHVDFETHQRTLRPDAQGFVDFLHKHKIEVHA